MTRPSREAEKWAVVVETLAGAEGLDPGALGSTLRSAGVRAANGRAGGRVGRGGRRGRDAGTKVVGVRV